MSYVQQGGAVLDAEILEMEQVRGCKRGSDRPMITIHLPGKPQGKGRPRATVRGGHATMYTPAKTRSYEGELKYFGQQAMGDRPPLLGPLSVVIVASFDVPASWSRKKTAAALRGEVRPTTKPDFDNLAKVCDALNGVVWKDDAQIVDGSVRKRYAREPGLRIEVRELDDPSLG